MRLTTSWLALGIFLWAGPLLAQETLRYDLSQSPLVYRVEIVQDMDVPLPGGESSLVRTDVTATMRWTVEGERPSGERVVKLAFTEFDTHLKTGDRQAQRHDHLEALAPFELIVVMDARGRVRDIVFDVSNPARLRALSLFNDIVVRALPLLPEGAVAPGAVWKDDLSREIKDDEVDAKGVSSRTFRLEAPGTVGFTNLGTLHAEVTVGDERVVRTTRLSTEGSGTFVGGVLQELGATTMGAADKSPLLGPSKVRTTVRLRLVK